MRERGGGSTSSIIRSPNSVSMRASWRARAMMLLAHMSGTQNLRYLHCTASYASASSLVTKPKQARTWRPTVVEFVLLLVLFLCSFFIFLPFSLSLFLCYFLYSIYSLSSLHFSYFLYPLFIFFSFFSFFLSFSLLYLTPSCLSFSRFLFLFFSPASMMWSMVGKRFITATDTVRMMRISPNSM